MTNSLDTQTTGVLIVGAGPVGLALAIEMGLRGIDCILVEQRDGMPRVPRMSQVSCRNMEFCRRWGIAEKVRGAVWSSTHPLDFVYATSLVGSEVARLKVPSYEKRGDLDYSPEGSCTCPQIFFDPILAEKAASIPEVSLRYETRLAGFDQDDDAVRARVADLRTGDERTIQARYMVGCDGAGGSVRRALDIPLDGLGALANSVNVFFRARDLIALHDKGWARFYRMVDDSGCWSELIAIDGDVLWRLTVFDDPSPDPEGHSYLRRMAGRDFDYEIIDVSPWERRDSLAHSFRSGRVFMAGDAVQQCSPTGGLGMHTGICEAVNLAWKLAAMFEGWGGPNLLGSYEAECRPMAGRYVDLSTATFNALAALPDAEGMRREMASGTDLLRTLTVPDQARAQIVFEGSPICVSDGTPAPEGPRRYEPSARPGARAPHCWIGDGRSTVDLFGEGFVLMRLVGSAADCAPLAEAAAERGVPLRIVDVPGAEIAALYERGLVLVRPDGHVAWRGDAPPDDALALIDRARGA